MSKLENDVLYYAQGEKVLGKKITVTEIIQKFISILWSNHYPRVILDKFIKFLLEKNLIKKEDIR